MKYQFIGLICSLFCFLQPLVAKTSDPASFVENVSTIFGDYSEVEVDLVVPAPDSLLLSRFYSSQDSFQSAPFGGWRFNPHCFLFCSKENSHCIDAGDPDGTIVTYTENLPFEFTVDPNHKGLANTAKGTISRWANVKNNKLYFNPITNSFELSLCSEGKRFYVKHPTCDFYILTHEILPSGNQIFYEFDEKGRLLSMQETNRSQTKVLAWIHLSYEHGVYVEASDGQTVDYRFEQDPSGVFLLTEVKRSNQVDLSYQYQVIDNQALLIKKNLPEGRFVQIDYDQNKVQSITLPSNAEETSTITFSYQKNCTEVNRCGIQTSIYRFDDQLQLTAIEQYVDKTLYRVHKQSWNRSNLISCSIEDGSGKLFYHKQFIYDDKNNLIEEREYGDALALSVSKDGSILHCKPRLQLYSHFPDRCVQTDETGSGVETWYKKGTTLLLKKFVLANRQIVKRHFYTYNDDAVLIRVDVDDGIDENEEDLGKVTERQTTLIIPKEDLPNIGAPQIIEQKTNNFLLNKTVNQFDAQGNISSQTLYDAEGSFCYTLHKKYVQGLLTFETDPAGNEIHYVYDANQNLIVETHHNTGISIEYEYDLRNRRICTTQKDREGRCFTTKTVYDTSGFIIKEVDRLGNQTLYINDSLGRPIQISYPEIGGKKPTYTYSYDLFDNPIAVTDPKGQTCLQSYNIQGLPVSIESPDGSKEVFKYDTGGRLCQYVGKDGTCQRLERDDLGRITNVQVFQNGLLKEKSSHTNIFHKLSETDELGNTTDYGYDERGRLSFFKKAGRTVEFIYDSLHRIHKVKKKHSAHVKEYDSLDRVIEERVENQNGKILTKKRYVYNSAGQLSQITCYPQNKETPLVQYEYDGFSRIIKIINGLVSTQIVYDDAYINEWGQRVLKQTLIDPMGNQTEEIFDVYGNKVKITQKDASDTLLSESEFFHDIVNNPIAEKTKVITNGRFSKTVEINRSFYSNNQLGSITFAKKRSFQFEYNVDGSIKAEHRPGLSAPLQYSHSTHLKTLFYPEKINYEWNYDLQDRLTQIKLNPSLEISYTYDAHDKVLSETIQDDFGSYQVSRSYNEEGLIQTLHLPDGSYVEYTYEGPFVKEAKRFDKDHQELYHYQVISRDLMGNILEEVLPGNVGQRTQTWDSSARRTNIITDFFQDQIPVDGFDVLNQITKRHLTVDRKTTAIQYEYNNLSQLISEKGNTKHTYSYDSLNNRLQKDQTSYKIDEFNQLIKAEGTFSFDLSGHLETKTINGKTWSYKTNPLGQIISIKDPDKNSIKFTYDLYGKRLSKQIKTKNKEKKQIRFFYLNDTEIGSIDEKGNLIELKIPSNPNHPEEFSFAIEIKKKIYVPIYDLLGNIACLLHPQKRKIVETYSYSAYGEETVHLKKNHTSTQNPWRYRGKRIDPETGLIYFGARYYDPQIGRWISPDPLGTIDGPNLYAYVHNNPITFIDYFGLATDVGESLQACICGYCTRNDGFCHCMGTDPTHNINICACRGISCAHKKASIVKTGSAIVSALGGISQGITHFVIRSIYDLQMGAAYVGSGELEIPFQERMEIIEEIERSQVNQIKAVENWITGLLSIDESDPIYQSFRSKTTLGLEIGSLVAGGYGVIKGVMAFNRFSKTPMQVSRFIRAEGIIVKNAGNSNSIWTFNKKFTSVENAYDHWLRHGKEFPELINAKQYVEFAHNFCEKPPMSTLKKIRSNGDIIFYHPSTNTFAITNKSRTPRTIYKPNTKNHPHSTNMEYYNAQR